MTKKHFERIAKALADARPEHRNENVEAIHTWMSLVREIADICAASNPSFRRQTFLDACGF